MHSTEIYDIVIIGGGMSGINCALKLSKNKKVLLLDEREYWGGRIITKSKPKYEIGAARFSNKHKLLNKLIKKYELNKIPLSQNIDYLHKTDNQVKIITNVDKILDKYFVKLLSKSKSYSQNKLKSITLFEFMNMCNEPEISQQIVNMFGYFSEIKMMNAYDALNTFREDFVNVQYYILKEGLTHLCNKMVEEAKQNGCVCKTGSFVTDVEKKEQYFEVKTRTHVYRGDKIIFAIKGGQLKHFNLLKPIHKYIDCIHNAELLRIYAKYPLRKSGVWFNNLRRMTTNSFLRQIIPINYEDGLIMISYTDGKDIEVFKDKKGKMLDETKIKDKIHAELNYLFKEKVPQPTYFKVHYWSVGAHHWKPGCNSNKISSLMINPLANIYICGEAFSQKQAWVEGALETSECVVEKIRTK